MTAGALGPKISPMSSKKTSSDARRERLAKALKDNIAKRKAQAKERRPAPAAPRGPDDDKGCPN